MRMVLCVHIPTHFWWLCASLHHQAFLSVLSMCIYIACVCVFIGKWWATCLGVVAPT